MWRKPLRTCNGPIPVSTISSFSSNLYRSGLGVGMSPAVKKAPLLIYRPGVGFEQPVCCLKAPYVPPLFYGILDGGTPRASGPRIIDGNGRALIVDGGKP